MTIKKQVKRILKKKKRVIDIIIFPFVIGSAFLLRYIRRSGIKFFPFSKKALLNIGIFPIREHYYEPQFNPKHLSKPLSDERILPGIDWNVNDQLALLKAFNFQDEFADISDEPVSENVFYFQNGSFLPGDAEYWYSIIRLKKPKKIIEIGCGNSTKMARLAIDMNKKLDPTYQCKHICIEPYELPNLEKLGVEVIREKVEDVDISFFEQLEADDILFVDSSHIIRPQGDVVTEYLELIPTLKSGVIVHIHDIFSPRNYLERWIVDEVLFWNEQYLLEAFLSFNSEWKIIGALNYLKHNHFELLKEKCPRLTSDNEPGSFYIVKS